MRAVQFEPLEMPGKPASLAVKTLAAITLAAALASCAAPPLDDYYNITPAEAFTRLHHADIKGFRDARQCGMLIYFSTSEQPPHSILWTVTSSQIPVASFTLHLAPQGTGTRITIEVPKGPNGAEIYDGQQKYSHPALMQPLRPAVRELIDAAIARRPYDWHRIPDPLNTDGFCGSLRQNFEASGQPYSLNDPSGMTHDQAEEARQKGLNLQVERDGLATRGKNPWAD